MDKNTEIIILGCIGLFRVLQGLSRDNGKENGNYYDLVYNRVYGDIMG